MKSTPTILLVAAFSVALVSSIPVPENQSLRSQALDALVMREGDNDEALRSKRTIGLLRQLFPGISQMIEQKVNAITAEVIRVLGPVVLRNVLGNGARGAGGVGGGGNNGGTSDDGTTVEIKSPFDDDDDDDRGNKNSDDSNGGTKISSKSQSGSKVSISLPTYPPDEEEDVSESSDISGASTTTTKSSSTSVSTNSGQSSSDVNREAEDRLTEDTAESQNNEVRVQFADEQASTNEASDTGLEPLDDIGVSDDENRNKRFLNFGFGASGGAGASAGSGGSGGGSGNFLFDIIRQAADGAARAAGTVYRVVAGTQSLGLGLSASRDVGPAPAPAAPAPSGPTATAGAPAPGPAAAPAPGTGTQPPLVAGSGSSQQGDVAAGAPSPGGRGDAATEAVPGPVTRLFVIANRGISNLIQDLILRLAATSERIVNFKARLITSII